MKSIRFTLVLAAAACVGLAQAPNTFSAAGNMTTARYAHTATLLNDGRVLIAGGFGSGFEQSQASAEIYDPHNGTFIATGDMTASRANHRAVLLPDGRVLIAGGVSGRGNALATAEVYDPSTGRFTHVVNLDLYPPVTLTLLTDGQALTTGRVPPGGYDAKNDAKLYDPYTGALNPAADIIPPRIGSLATLLANGQVLFSNHSFEAGGGALYDPVTHTLSSTNDFIPYNIEWATANLLMNGDVLLFGDSLTGLLYHPPTGAITNAGMPRGEGFSSTLLGNGTVLLLNAMEFSGPAQIYDPVVRSFSDTGRMIFPRMAPTTTLLQNGQVLLTGGYTPRVAGAELYTPPVLTSSPVLFSLSSDGKGQGAIWHAGTGQLASPDMPAVAGEALSMYTAGLADGSVIPPQIAIGGRVAEILFFGAAPGYPGFSQVNVRVPNGVAPGSAVPVRLSYLTRPSNAVTIGVQ